LVIERTAAGGGDLEAGGWPTVTAVLCGGRLMTTTVVSPLSYSNAP